MNNLSYLFFIIMLLFPIIDNTFAETWRVKIPSGSSEITSPVHYIPSEISVRLGDKVEWGNADSVSHTVTSGSLETGVTGMFDSGHMKPGDTFSMVFTREDHGEIKYFCTIHPWMIGIVNVVNIPEDFQVFHNVGSDVSDFPVDMTYKVQRNLVDVDVDTERNTLTFSFAGQINKDEFIVLLPDELIKDPQSVWINDLQTPDYELKQVDGVKRLVVTLDDIVHEIKVVGTDVIGKFNPKKYVMINQMFGITDKKFYDRGDEIVISGEILNPSQLYRVSLDVISPDGVTMYHKEVPIVDSTKFTDTVPTSGVFREFGEYTAKITGPSAKTLFLHFSYGIEPPEIKPPLKQMKSGIIPSDVTCNEGLELLMKNSNGNAACVTKHTGEILLQRGWANYF